MTFDNSGLMGIVKIIITEPHHSGIFLFFTITFKLHMVQIYTRPHFGVLTNVGINIFMVTF